MLSAVVGCGGKSDSKDSSSKDKPVLRFSAIPDQNATELNEKFSAIAKYLSTKLKVDVEYVPVTDYQASVDAFKSGDIQLAWFGGLTGVQARHAVKDAVAIAQGESDPKFRSYFIAHKSTGLTKSDAFPEAMSKHSFTFGSESSTSGRLMPEFFLRKETGKSPEEFFGGKPRFSGSHDSTIELVSSGEVQAGVVNFKVYDKRVADGKTDPDTCRIVWITPEYADYNFTAHPKLTKMFGEKFIADLQAALLEMNDPELIAAFPRKKLIAAKNEDFSGIEDVARQLGFLR